MARNYHHLSLAERDTIMAMREFAMLRIDSNGTNLAFLCFDYLGF